MVADVRGTYVDDATRMMKYILSNKLVMKYNMSGRHGEKTSKQNVSVLLSFQCTEFSVKSFLNFNNGPHL